MVKEPSACHKRTQIGARVEKARAVTTRTPGKPIGIHEGCPTGTEVLGRGSTHCQLLAPEGVG